MAKKRKKEKEEVQKFQNFQYKRSFFDKIKIIFDNCLNVLSLITKMEIVDTSFNCRNKILYIKYLMHI